MKTAAITLRTLIFLLVFVTRLAAQDQRTFNQNSSRSNHYSSYATTGFDFSFSPVYSTSLNSTNDSLLFRGSGGGIKFGGDYFFGKAGIGLSSGFGSSSPDNNAINRFLQKANIPMDQVTITKSNQQNMYLLLGPSLRFGNNVELLLHAKGGLFINNGGLVMIQQKGAIRAAYRNESTNKSIYPGFQTGLNVQYNTKSDVWSFGIGADYMGTKTEINNYDARRGGGIEGLKLSKNISDLVAGITIRYNIHSARDQATGLATGRLLPTVNKRESSTGMATGRLLPTVNKREIISPRDAQSGLATGRVLPTVNKKEIAIDEQGVHKTLAQNCGPVIVKTTNPDGTTTEKTFACPDDAAAYVEKINTEKQKTWLPSNFRTSRDQGTGGGIVSGRLTWPSSNTLGIITNKTMEARGGSTTMNSQTSSTRTTPSTSFGTMVRMSAREAGSGMATGKRSREASSGLATGRLFEPIFAEGQDDVCNPCIAAVKSNPLYKSKMSAAQNNPLYKENERVDEDCDGIASVDVSLIDLNSGIVVAKTKTESCGDFFFANVPEGNYIVKVSGVIAAKKGYDVYMKSKTDLLGSIEEADDPVQLWINAGGGSSNASAINNSHSNIKNLILIEADLDGDGGFESLRAQGTFSDGTTQDISANARIASGKKNIVIDGDALRMFRRRVEVLKSNRQLSSITVVTGSPDSDGKTEIINNSHSNIKNLKAIAAFSDGSTQDVTDALAINTSHSNIKQYSIVVADLDDDGIADAVIKTKTKSNQSNDRVAAGDLDGDGLAGAIINTSRSNIKSQRIAAGDINGDGTGDAIWSPRSNVMLLRVAAGDVNGDGVAELLVGNQLSGLDMRAEEMKSFFEKGDRPTQSQRTPGDPIPGLDVKLGRNPGGQSLQTTTANGEGEFKFTGLDAGDYFIIVEQNILIDNETIVTVTGDAEENINTSESNLKSKEIKVSASQNGQTLRAQNNNTVRSNRTELKSILIEADLDGDGEYESDVTSQLNDEITIDESGQISAPQMKAGISTSRSNIRTRSALQAVGDGIYISFGKAVLNNKEVDVKSVLKTKHDTVKNSIGNIR